VRNDLFQNKKSVHINLSKEVHTALREKLFRHNITMQDLFQEAADLILQDGSAAERLIQRISKRKMMTSLQRLDKKNNSQMGQFDAETLYNLLEAQDDRKTEE